MSKRRIVYGGQVPRALDILENARNWLVATGRGFMDTFRSNVDPALNTYPTLVAGFTPTYPGGTQLTLAAGRIYSYQAVDATAYGEDPIDARQVYQQGEAEIQTLTFGAAPGAGLTRIDIVQVRYLQQDTDPAVLLYYNSENPDEPLSGPGGNNNPDNQNRSELAVVQVKAGTASGSPVAPTPDAGFSLLFTITVPNGLTNIASGNVAPNTSLFLAGLLSQHHLGLPGTAPKIDLTSEVQNSLPGTQVADSGGTTAQAVFNRTRSDRGSVADFTARDALANKTDLDFVVVGDDGSGNTVLQRYKSASTTWVTIATTGGTGTDAATLQGHPAADFLFVGATAADSSKLLGIPGAAYAPASQFSQNSATTTGLTFGYRGGLRRSANVVSSVGAGTVALTNNAINYVEVDPTTGTVAAQTTGSFTTGKYALYVVTTVSGNITTSVDARTFVNSATSNGGSSGSITLVVDPTTAAATTTFADGAIVLIENFGLYRFVLAATDLADGETIILVTSGGRLFLESPHVDFILGAVAAASSDLQNQVNDLVDSVMTVNDQNSKIVTVAVTIIFGTVSANSTVSVTLSIGEPLLIAGTPILVGQPTTLASGIIVTAFVSAIGVITIKACNFTTGSIAVTTDTYLIEYHLQ